MNDAIDGGTCYLGLSDGGRQTVTQVRPCFEHRDADIAQECRRAMYQGATFDSQYMALVVLESLPEVQ